MELEINFDSYKGHGKKTNVWCCYSLMIANSKEVFECRVFEFY